MGHAWVRIEENADVSIGLDDFALRLLGPLDHIEVPLIGNTVSHQDKPVIIIGRGSHKASVLSPVSGVVSTINLSVKENPVIAGEDPYARGWILKVHTDNLRHDLKNLLIGSEAVKQLEQEIERLLREIEMTTGVSLHSDTDIQQCYSEPLAGHWMGSAWSGFFYRLNDKARGR
jgi:glycine cleavage system H lipoate-binding protein